MRRRSTRRRPAADILEMRTAMHTRLPKWVIFDRNEADRRSRHVGYALIVLQNSH